MIATTLLVRRGPNMEEQVYLPCLPRTGTVFVNQLQLSSRMSGSVSAARFCKSAFGLKLARSRFFVISSDFGGGVLVFVELRPDEQLDMRHTLGPAPLPDQITPWTNLSAALGLGHGFLDDAMQRAMLILAGHLHEHPLRLRNCLV